MGVRARASSGVRAAFEAAAEGIQQPLSVEVFPTTSYGTAVAKLSRMLGPDGDLNPPWAALDAIFAERPDVVLRWLCEAARYRMPEPLPEPEAHSLARIADDFDEIKQRFEQLELALSERLERVRKGPIRVEPEKRRGRGAA